MSISSPPRFGKILVKLATLCVFLVGASASVFASTVAVTFSGPVKCDTSFAPCTINNGTVTGTYNYDEDLTFSNALVGSWSFSTPVGAISSADSMSDGGCSPINIVSGPTEQCSFTDFFKSSGSSYTLIELFLTFPSAGAAEGGAPIVINNRESFLELATCPVSTSSCEGVEAYNFTQGVTTTPEPSPLVLLGTGLVGLGFLVRRHV